MEIVRTVEKVRMRLKDVYGKSSFNHLFNFWLLLATEGEESVRRDYSKSQFYVNKKKLTEANVSWINSNIIVLPKEETALPKDFAPIISDPRRCTGGVSPRSIFNPFQIQKQKTKIEELLDDVKKAKGIESDYALAKELGVNTGLISYWYSGKTTPNEYACLQIAKALEKDVKEILAIVQISTEKNEKRRSVWKEFYREIGGVTTGVTGIFFTIYAFLSYTVA
jgi:transcriptional regulator with XRE-family HTH domain